MAGEVTITLDRERRLRVDINALADADEVAGKSINEFLAGERVGLAAIRALLWAGLKHEDRRLTIEAAGALVQAEIAKGGSALVDLAGKIREALVASGIFGSGEKGDGEKNAPAEPGKSSSSANG